MVQIVLDKEIGQLIPVLLDARGRTIDGLAEIYRKQGAKPGEIVQLVADKTGYDRTTVDGYLRVEFKDKTHRESTLQGLERTAPTRKLVAAARQAQDEVNKTLTRELRDPALDEDNKKLIAREVKNRLNFAKA